jgi:GAF domain-containing protein
VNIVILIGSGYLVFVAFVVALLRASKLADKDMARQVRAELPAELSLDRVVAQVHRAFEADHVTVVVADPEEPAMGRIEACLGAPSLVGRRIPVERTPATGVVGAPQAERLGLAPERQAGKPWRFAHVPIAGEGETLGTVTVARRSRAFDGRDLEFIEHLARSGAHQFDRRSSPREPERVA